jgi:hypothetical protein
VVIWVVFDFFDFCIYVFAICNNGTAWSIRREVWHVCFGLGVVFDIVS